MGLNCFCDYWIQFPFKTPEHQALHGFSVAEQNNTKYAKTAFANAQSLAKANQYKQALTR